MNNHAWLCHGKWKRKVSATILRKPHVDWGLCSWNISAWIHITILTNGEPTAEILYSVYSHQLWYFLPHDFANFWSEVRYWYSKTSNTAGFLIKIFLNDPIKKNCFFDHSVNFLVNFLSQDFVQTLRNENLEG